MPLGFGFGIGTRNYNDLSDDDESDDGGYAIAPLAGAGFGTAPHSLKHRWSKWPTTGTAFGRPALRPRRGGHC